MSHPRIALLGSRGIPANYGGYETLMEELAPRLGARGFDVTVYCRSHHTPPEMTEYRGSRLVVLPTITTKHLDTPVHTLLASLHASRRGFDAALVVNSANAIFLPILRWAGTATALHVDGIERQRAKWGLLGRSTYALSERLAGRFPDVVVSDAEVVRQYFEERWSIDSTVIAYGVDPRPEPAGDQIQRLGLEPQRYFLYVSRFEPENNPHRVAEAYRDVVGDLPLVMVGDAPYSRSFIHGFTEDADPRIVFPGAIYGDGYRELLTNAFAYIHATEVGGTHPALVEAMGYGNCVVVNDTPENVEAAGGNGLLFRADRPESLTTILNELVAHPETAASHGDRAARHAVQAFNWNRVADQYAELFAALIEGSRGPAVGLSESDLR